MRLRESLLSEMLQGESDAVANLCDSKLVEIYRFLSPLDFLLETLLQIEIYFHIRIIRMPDPLTALLRYSQTPTPLRN